MVFLIYNIKGFRTAIKDNLSLIAIFSFLLILVSFVFILYFLTCDISEKELGQSPFIIDPSISSMNNLEFMELAKIGDMIEDEIVFANKYNLKLHGAEASRPQLREYIQKNKLIFENATPELFKACKLPALCNYNHMELYSFLDLMNFLQLKLTNDILLHDFENTKIDFIIINEINSDLISKSVNIFEGIMFMKYKGFEFENIELLVNDDYFSIEQKLLILSIKQELISTQLLKQIAYFESGNLKLELQETQKEPPKNRLTFHGNPNIPFVSYYSIQPNKSVKLFRKITSEIIDMIEESTFEYKTDLKNINPFDAKYTSIYVPNNEGYQIVYEKITDAHFLQIPYGINNHNNKCKQISLAKKLLIYKIENGTLPSKLEELKLDKDEITDLYGYPFSYSAENGILQGSQIFNYNQALTKKTLTAKEIKDIMFELRFDDIFILNLK